MPVRWVVLRSKLLTRLFYVFALSRRTSLTVQHLQKSLKPAETYGTSTVKYKKVAIVSSQERPHTQAESSGVPRSQTATSRHTAMGKPGIAQKPATVTQPTSLLV